MFQKMFQKLYVGKNKDDLTVEDMPTNRFSLFAEAVPSCFCFIGTQRPDEPAYPLHNPRHFPPEDVIAIGAALYANGAATLAAQ